MADLGTLLAALGVVLGRSWGVLGQTWAVLGRTWAVSGAVLGDLGVVLGCLEAALGCPWPLSGDLGAAGCDFESILDRLGVVWGWILNRFGWIRGRFELICWIYLIFFRGLALMRSNVPQVSQTFF